MWVWDDRLTVSFINYFPVITALKSPSPSHIFSRVCDLQVLGLIWTWTWDFRVQINSHFIYSPSCCSKPGSLTSFCVTYKCFFIQIVSRRASMLSGSLEYLLCVCRRTKCIYYCYIVILLCFSLDSPWSLDVFLNKKLHKPYRKDFHISLEEFVTFRPSFGEMH